MGLQTCDWISGSLQKFCHIFQTEMQLVLKAGGSPSDIIFSNTIKFPSHLKFAAEIGVSLMTFDNERELVKIKELAPRSR